MSALWGSSHAAQKATEAVAGVGLGCLTAGGPSLNNGGVRAPAPYLGVS